MKPKFIVSRADVEELEGAYPPPFDVEKMALGRDLGRAAGTMSFGVSLDRIPPGRRSSFTHAHSDEEEAIYVLEGRPSVRIIENGKTEDHPLAPGDFVAFPPGTGIAHAFVNHSDSDALILVIGERRPGDRVFYAEDQAFDAWHAENRPLRHWSR